MAERYRIFFNALENYPTNLKFRAVNRELARSVTWRHFCSVCAILRVLFRLGIRACDSLWWYGMMWLLSCALWIFRYAAMRVSFEETGRISSTFFHFVEFALARCPQIWTIGGSCLGNFIREVVWYQSKNLWYGWWWTILKKCIFPILLFLFSRYLFIFFAYSFTLWIYLPITSICLITFLLSFVFIIGSFIYYLQFIYVFSSHTISYTKVYFISIAFLKL